MNSDYSYFNSNLSKAAIKTETARNGKKIILFNDNCIHSKYDPVKEGEKIAAKTLSRKKYNSIRIFGLGFGYHILPVLDKYDEITIFEPVPEILEMARKLDFLADLFEKAMIVSNLNTLERTSNQDILILPSYRNFFQEQIRIFQESTGSMVINRNTTDNVDYKGMRVMIDFPVYGGSYTTAEYILRACSSLGLHVKTVDNAHAETMLHTITSIENKSHSSYMALKLTELLSDIFWEEFKAFKPHMVIFPAQSPATKHLLNSIREASNCVSVFLVC